MMGNAHVTNNKSDIFNLQLSESAFGKFGEELVLAQTLQDDFEILKMLTNASGEIYEVVDIYNAEVMKII